jgi:hypothetical protein
MELTTCKSRNMTVKTWTTTEGGRGRCHVKRRIAQRLSCPLSCVGYGETSFKLYIIVAAKCLGQTAISRFTHYAIEPSSLNVFSIRYSRIWPALIQPSYHIKTRTGLREHDHNRFQSVVDLAHFCGQCQFLLAIPITNTSHFKSCTISTRFK